MKPVTDPALLEQLNARSPVTDPAILAQLNGEEEKEFGWKDRVNQALQGATFGFSDEIGTAIAATAAKAGGSDEDWKAIYNSMMESEQGKRDEFVEANTVEAAALNIGGALSTGGVSLAKSLAPKTVEAAKALANSPKLVKALRGAGIMSAEGAVAGAGSARQGERLKGAGEGAVLGPVAGGVLSGAGKVGKGLVNSASRRRIAQELGKGDDFIPLNIADPNPYGVGKLYQSFLGKAFGSKIPEQTQKVVSRAGPSLTKSRNAARQMKQGMVEGRANKQGMVEENITNAANQKSSEIKLNADLKRQQIDAQKEAVIAGTRDTGEAATQRTNQAWREERIDSALLPSMDDEARAALRSAHPHEAAATLAEEWPKRGFADAKSRVYEVDAETVIDDALQEIVGVPGIEDHAKAIKASLKHNIVDKAEEGIISGENMINARNALRIQANELTQEGGKAVQSKALERAARNIDDIIESQMDDAGVELFRSEKNAWGNWRKLQDSIRKATVKKQGLFEPEDWLSSVNTKKSKESVLGKASGQQESMAAQRANKAVGDMAKDVEQTAKKSAAAKKRGLTEATAAQRAELGREKSAAHRKLSEMKTAQGKITDADMTLGATAADEAATGLKKATPDTESVLGRIGATLGISAFGAVPGFLVGGPAGGLLAGAATSRALSGQGAQRLRAGQTGAQKGIQSLLRGYEGSSGQRYMADLARAIRRGAVTYEEEE